MIERWTPREPLRFWLACGWIAALALTGGASRADDPHQIAVRLLAAGVIVVALWTPPAERLRRHSGPLLFAGAAAALVLVQLLPLPPGLWSALPGRGLYADLAARAGVADAWRPLTLTPDLTINALLALLPPFATLVVVVTMPRGDRPLLLLPLLAAALSGALLGLLQVLTGTQSSFRLYTITNADHAVGWFANRNHHAITMACAIALLGPLAASRGASLSWQRAAPALMVAVGLALGVAILTAGSRTGLLAGVLAAVVSAVQFAAIRRAQAAEPRRRRERQTRWTRARPVIAVALPLAAVASLLAFTALSGRATALRRLVETPGSEESRIRWLGPLVEMATSFFPAGSGFGSFDAAYRRFEPFDLLQTTYANQAHNDLVQLVIEGGLPGVALLALFLAWLLPRAIAAWRTPLTVQPGLASARAGSLVVVLLLLASLGDYPLRVPALMGVFVIACLWLGDDRRAAGRRAPA